MTPAQTEALGGTRRSRTRRPAGAGADARRPGQGKSRRLHMPGASLVWGHFANQLDRRARVVPSSRTTGGRGVTYANGGATDAIAALRAWAPSDRTSSQPSSSPKGRGRARQRRRVHDAGDRIGPVATNPGGHHGHGAQARARPRTGPGRQAGARPRRELRHLFVWTRPGRKSVRRAGAHGVYVAFGGTLRR